MNDKQIPSKKRILLATAASMLVAVIVLFVAVLPAEYGVDPLGTGKSLGLIGLSGSQVSALQQQPGQWHKDSIEFQLAPFEALEYKYHMFENGALMFSWEAEEDVLFDLHSEADDHAVAEQSFAKGRQQSDNGVLRAPFTGIHGWYFQNRGMGDITLRLHVAGFFDYSVEMTDGPMQRYEFE
jgi:hypothetical protein